MFILTSFLCDPLSAETLIEALVRRSGIFILPERFAPGWGCHLEMQTPHHPEQTGQERNSDFLDRWNVSTVSRGI
jgi:hypothetical protein